MGVGLACAPSWARRARAWPAPGTSACRSCGAASAATLMAGWARCLAMADQGEWPPTQRGKRNLRPSYLFNAHCPLSSSGRTLPSRARCVWNWFRSVSSRGTGPV